MKKQLLSAIICVILALACSLNALPAAAQSLQDDEIDRLMDGIIRFNLNECGAGSIQEWIELSLAPGAGISSETYILALHQSGEVYDYSSYSRSLLAYLDRNNVSNASSREKYALSLLAANCRSDYLSGIIDRSAGELGVMSRVFALHLYGNGCTGEVYTEERIISELLELQLADGGWAVSGDISDVDVTAMVIQSLAPRCGSRSVCDAVDKALAFLSESQLPDGTFSSYGKENANSTAQVIIALAAMGIDVRTDQRFIKGSSSALDGLVLFRLENGSFCHEREADSNRLATAQAFSALVSVKRQQASLGSLYILDPQPDNTVEYVPAPPDDTVPEPTTAAPMGYKVWVCLAVWLCAAAACVILCVIYKRNIKNILVIPALAAVVTVFVLSTNIQCASDYYRADGISKTDIVGTVTMSIRCDSIAGTGSPQYIPEDGIILDCTVFRLSEGETVYDILVEAARTFGIQLENDGSAGMAYISGINHIYELEHGSLSGWVYLVNGEQPSTGCSDYALSDGDRIEWVYSLESGRDLA